MHASYWLCFSIEPQHSFEIFPRVSTLQKVSKGWRESRRGLDPQARGRHGWAQNGLLTWEPTHPPPNSCFGTEFSCTGQSSALCLCLLVETSEGSGTAFSSRIGRVSLSQCHIGLGRSKLETALPSYPQSLGPWVTFGRCPGVSKRESQDLKPHPSLPLTPTPQTHPSHNGQWSQTWRTVTSTWETLFFHFLSSGPSLWATCLI